MEVAGYSELVRTLLARRGVEKEEDIAAFLNPDYVAHTHDPFLLQGMKSAVARVLAAMADGERIAIYADFDCDGIPGAALLSDLFRKLEYENFEVYLPHRDREGYGFHTAAIAALAARGVSLIITIDVGTNATDAVRFAKERGVDVIVTDHHEVTGPPAGGLPNAVAVLNPKIVPPALSGPVVSPSTALGTGSAEPVEGYPFPHLCGAAVAFKLAQALLIEGKCRGIENFVKVQDGWEKWLLDMVAIATIADMVPLVGENRALAHWGLAVLRKSPRPGIRAMCRKLRLAQQELTESDIGFSIAPRINAASRMDEPDLAFKLLTTADPIEAEALVAKLEKLNASRKGIVASVVRQARIHVDQRFTAHERVVVLGNTDWKPALLGLAANSIMGERGGVVCLWGRDVNGNLKGSCRSDGSVSLTELFANAGDVFEECGGHNASGGFTVSYEQVHNLPDALRAAADGLPKEASGTSIREHDFLLTVPEVSHALLKDVSKLAPFGVGNPKPVFLFGGITITDVRRFGKENNHVEVMLECSRTGAKARAFDFFKSPDDFSLCPAPGLAAGLLATVERDMFSARGRGGLALRIVDVIPA